MKYTNHKMSATLLLLLPQFLLLLLVVAVSIPPGAGAAVPVYPYTFDPKENPDHSRYAVPHPSLDVFSPQPQFATLRSIPAPNSHIDDYQGLVELYVLNPNTTLGGVIWPRAANFLFADNFEAFIDYVRTQGLYVTSVHGFSPDVAGYRPPRASLDYLEQKLGSRWFGMSNGEQDGHYFNSFAPRELPLNVDPRDQYINCRDYFRELEAILGPRMTTLLSSTYPHYQLKSGLYTLAGAESSQHGPNAQVRYAFIRGAGKQYGVLWFGNVSVYGGFGHKEYVTPGMVTSADFVPSSRKRARRFNGDGGGERVYKCVKDFNPQQSSDILAEESPAGPTCGTSLNLMKRLMYSQMMYNTGYVSFEGNWFYREKLDTLTPIGVIQHNAYLWTKQRENTSLGVHTPTLALYLDFFSGWTAPRHKQGIIYRTWSNLPYSKGDYLTDNILRMIYPSYQDAPYFHDEHAVSSHTPYGDTADVILSDAAAWVLSAYNTIIVASELSGGSEIRDNLLSFVSGGGHLVLTAGNLAKMPNGLFGVSSKLDCGEVQAGAKIVLEDSLILTETYNMSVCDLKLPEQSMLLAKLSDSTPLAVKYTHDSGGSVIVFATPFAISSSPVCKPSSEIDQTICTPYPLLDHVKHILDPVFKTSSVFHTSANLSLVPAIVTDDVLNVLVTNPSLKQQPLDLQTQHGSIVSMTEIKLDQSEKGQVGYLPDGFEGTDIGKSTNTTIAGGDTRLFRVQLSSGSTKFIAKVPRKPRPRGVGLHIRHVERSIRHEILRRPTFFQHFDSVVVDFSYLITKDETFLKEESQWLRQQGVSVYVDASSSINLFPTLRLTDDAPDLFNKSKQELTSLLHKMYELGSQNLVLSLHKFPNGVTKNQIFQDFNATLQYLVSVGSQLNITLHMLDTPKNQLSATQLLRQLEAWRLSGIKLVLNLAQLLDYSSEKYNPEIMYNSSILYINAPAWEYGQKYANNFPVSRSNVSIQSKVLSILEHVCVLRECPYSNPAQHVQSNHPHNTFRKLKSVPKGGDREGEGGATTRGPFYPIVMDAVYADHDTEYADVHFVEKVLWKG